jgi:hypothetical protein
MRQISKCQRIRLPQDFSTGWVDERELRRRTPGNYNSASFTIFAIIYAAYQCQLDPR